MRKKRKEESDERGERKENKKILNTYSIYVCMLSYMRAYYSLMPNILAFTTLDESGFLILGVSNAKNLAFDTPDENALAVPQLLFCLSMAALLWTIF